MQPPQQIATFARTQFIAGKVPSARPERAVDRGKHLRQLRGRTMQQASMCPHGIIAGLRRQFIKPHHPRAKVPAFVRLRHHCRNTIGGINRKPARLYPRRILPTATAKLQHRRAWFKPIEKPVKLDRMARRMAECVMRRGPRIEFERYRIEGAVHNIGTVYEPFVTLYSRTSSCVRQYRVLGSSSFPTAFC